MQTETIHPNVAVRQLGPGAVLIVAPGQVRVVRRITNWWRQGWLGHYCHNTTESLILHAPDDYTPISLPEEPVGGWPIVYQDSGSMP